MTSPPRLTGLYAPSPEGVVTCRLCYEPDGRHAPACPALIMHGQIKELSAQLWLFAAMMRETVDVLDQLLGVVPPETQKETDS